MSSARWLASIVRRRAITVRKAFAAAVATRRLASATDSSAIVLLSRAWAHCAQLTRLTSGTETVPLSFLTSCGCTTTAPNLIS